MARHNTKFVKVRFHRNYFGSGILGLSSAFNCRLTVGPRTFLSFTNSCREAAAPPCSLLTRAGKQSGSKGKPSARLAPLPTPTHGAFFQKIGLLSRNLFGGPVCSYQYSRDVEDCQTFPLSRTQPTVVTRRIVYSRNNQHCLCAPLHIQVYNAVYTARAVCIPDVRQATIHSLPRE